jgi:hypothetical protein
MNMLTHFVLIGREKREGDCGPLPGVAGGGGFGNGRVITPAAGAGGGGVGFGGGGGGAGAGTMMRRPSMAAQEAPLPPDECPPGESVQASLIVVIIIIIIVPSIHSFIHSFFLSIVHSPLRSTINQ